MLKKLWKWFKKYPVVYTKIDPRPKKYRIDDFSSFYPFFICYPKTEVQYLELLLVYDGILFDDLIFGWG